MSPKQEAAQQTILTVAYHNYEKKLKQYAFFKVSNRQNSEDLVQETFIKTWKYLLRGGNIEVMKAFLYHVLNNLIVDEYRKRKTTSLDALIEKGIQPSVDHSERLLNCLDGKAALLLTQRLPEKYKKVIRMKYTQDLSLEEMSLITGQSKNSIAVQLHRGLEKLKLLFSYA